MFALRKSADCLEDISDDITSIKSEGFDIDLPAYAPSNSNQVISAYKKGDGIEVTVSHFR